MQLDRYTVKSQEALDRAQRLARDHSPFRAPARHLLAALLEEPDGTIAGC
jgi:ATP-dependent Clp protease ATP-binding subunit ClpB